MSTNLDKKTSIFCWELNSLWSYDFRDMIIYKRQTFKTTTIVIYVMISLAECFYVIIKLLFGFVNSKTKSYVDGSIRS